MVLERYETKYACVYVPSNVLSPFQGSCRSTLALANYNTTLIAAGDLDVGVFTSKDPWFIQLIPEWNLKSVNEPNAAAYAVGITQYADVTELLLQQWFANGVRRPRRFQKVLQKVRESLSNTLPTPPRSFTIFCRQREKQWLCRMTRRFDFSA